MIRAVYHRPEHRLIVRGHAPAEFGGVESRVPRADADLPDTPESEHSDRSESTDTCDDPLLCASVSTLLYTLAAALIDLSAAGQISDPDALLRPGNAALRCRSSFASRGAVLLTFDTVARGLALLAAKFPEYMSYEERE